jgi:hypothetical protein
MEEARIGQLDRDWEWRRQGKGSWKVAGNILNILYMRQGSGSWKRAGNGGDREKPVRKGVVMEKAEKGSWKEGVGMKEAGKRQLEKSWE